MTDVNFGHLAKMAQKILDEQENGLDFMLSDVQNRTQAAYERFPADQVIRAVAFTIEKMASKQGPASTINQKQISDIYNHYVRLSSDTHFRDILGDLLLTKIAVDNNNDNFVKANRGDGTMIDLSKDIDQELAKSFESFMSVDKTSYDKKAQSLGAKYVKAGIEALGFKVYVDYVGGDTKSLVYTAGFDTNNGLLKVAIPIEINNGQLCMPEVFYDGESLKRLNRQNIEEFLPKIANEVNTIIRDDNKFVDIGKIEMPKELAHIASDFENSVLEASSIFGKEAVQKGKDIVAYELRNAGFKNPQVRYGSDARDSVVYLANVNTKSGTVEIAILSEMRKVANNRYMPLVPSNFSVNGNIEEFNAHNLISFANKDGLQVKTASTNYQYMNLKDIKKELLNCVANNSYDNAEKIIGFVQENFSEEDFINTVADYSQWLTIQAKQENQIVRKCSLQIAAGKTSIEPVCGHHHVPMSKVSINEFGECRLKTALERERLNPVEDSGAFISTAKIFMS